ATSSWSRIQSGACLVSLLQLSFSDGHPVISEYCDALNKALSEIAPTWAQTVDDLSRQRLIQQPHGDMPRWQDAVQALPDVAATVEAGQGCVTLKQTDPQELTNRADLIASLQQLMPW